MRSILSDQGSRLQAQKLASARHRVAEWQLTRGLVPLMRRCGSPPPPRASDCWAPAKPSCECPLPSSGDDALVSAANGRSPPSLKPLGLPVRRSGDRVERWIGSGSSKASSSAHCERALGCLANQAANPTPNWLSNAASSQVMTMVSDSGTVPFVAFPTLQYDGDKNSLACA